MHNLHKCRIFKWQFCTNSKVFKLLVKFLLKMTKYPKKSFEK